MFRSDRERDAKWFVFLLHLWLVKDLATSELDFLPCRWHAEPTTDRPPRSSQRLQTCISHDQPQRQWEDFEEKLSPYKLANVDFFDSYIHLYSTFAYQYCTIYTNLTNLIWIGRHIYFIVSNIFTVMCIIAFLKLAVYLLCRGVMKTRRAQRWKTMKLASVSPSSAESQDGFF